MHNLQEYVVFKLNNEHYGVSIGYVENIEKLVPITRVPYTVPSMKGVVNLRGIIVPIIDLRERFMLPEFVPTDESRMIILNIDDNKIGIRVDASSEVMVIDEANIDVAPNIKKEASAEYVKSIGKKDGRVIMLIDLAKVLDMEV